MPDPLRSFITLYKDDKAISPFESRVIWSTVKGRFSLSNMCNRDSLGFVIVTLSEARIALDILSLDALCFVMDPL